MLIVWILVFIISLTILVKGSDWLLSNAEKIGLAIGLSSFVVGITIVSIGTSFPELISGLAAVFKGVNEVAPANAIGSNIANILLIIGVSSAVAKRLTVTKNLINLDLPLLAISTTILLAVLWDGKVVLGEAILLLITYIIYLFYSVSYREEKEEPEEIEILPSRLTRRRHIVLPKKEIVEKPKIGIKNFIFLFIGIICLAIGAKYLIESLIRLSEILKVAPGVISITAVAVGTSLPELVVSFKAAKMKKPEIALGNIFGSNIFNALVVVGLPGIFGNLVLDEKTFSIGLPVMALSTLLFVISGISRKIYIWEGLMFLIFYFIFIIKLFGLF